MQGNNITGKRVIVNFVWKFMERTGIQIVNLLVQMVLARIIVPDDFAAVAIIMVFINIANIFVQSGLGTALIQCKEVNQEDYCSVFYISLFISLCMIIALFFVAPGIELFYGVSGLTELIRVQSFVLLTGSFCIVPQAILSRAMEFRKNFIASIIGCSISGIIGICLAAKGIGIWSVIVINIMNNLIYSLVLWIVVRWRPNLLFSTNSMKRMFCFGWKILVANLIGTIYDNLRTLIIGKAYSQSSLAYYNRADIVSSSVMNGITGAISAVMLPVLSQQQDNTEVVRNMLSKTFKINCFICMPMMFGLAAVGDNIIIVLFSEAWVESGLFLSIICIGYAFYPIHSANLQAIYALGRSDVVLKLEIIKRIIGTILILISIPFGVYMMAISVVIMSIISIVINAYPNIKFLKYSIIEQIKDIGIYLLLSIIMMVIVYVAGILLSGYNVVLVLIFQILLGVIVYGMGCAIVKPYAYEYCLNICKNVLLKKYK